MEKRKGIFALDLDGTLVFHGNPIDARCVQFLQKVSSEGWKILFATGRTLPWTLPYVEAVHIPCYIAAYNGACIVELPSMKYVYTSFLTYHDMVAVGPWLHSIGGCIYEALGDRIFYIKDPSGVMDLHLEKRRLLQKEEWIEISSIEQLPEMVGLSVRLFTTKEKALQISKDIVCSQKLSAPIMQDAYVPDISIIQVTSSSASKGQAVHRINKESLPVIAAGNDRNDIDLLSAATVAIATCDAPEILKEKAHIITHSPNILGMIDALSEAMRLV